MRKDSDLSLDEKLALLPPRGMYSRVALYPLVTLEDLLFKVPVVSLHWNQDLKDENLVRFGRAL